MTTTLCAECKTHTAVIKRGGQAICIDCYNEQPLPPLTTWDKLMRPETIAMLEGRIDELEKTMLGLGDILKDMNKLDKMFELRLKALERIIADWTAEK